MHAGGEPMSADPASGASGTRESSAGAPSDRAMPQRRTRDVGSALPLVLVLMVIGALIVIPMLSYTVTVMRHNTTLSEKTQRIEALRARPPRGAGRSHQPVRGMSVCRGDRIR